MGEQYLRSNGIELAYDVFGALCVQAILDVTDPSRTVDFLTRT
jgi:hypothetical protein